MLQKANSELVRKRNRGLVLESLRRHGPMARVQLGHVTGLSPASITTISAGLLDEGLIFALEDEARPLTAQRGRPLTKLSLNPDACCVMAISVTADGTTLAVADFAGRMVDESRLDINTFTIEREQFALKLASAIRSYARDRGNLLAKIARISIAVQGVADTNEGSIAWSPAFEARDIPVTRPLSELLNIPCVIANNTNRIADALLAENDSKYGGATAVVFLGHGVGLGLILDGKVFEGASGRASEIGHMNHDPQGPLCRCGMRGCLEAYSADYGIYRLAGGTGKSAVGIRKPLPPGTMEKLQRDAEAGDERALFAFSRAGEVLGFGLSRLIALINPSLVVFTGPGTTAFHLMRPSLHDAIARSLVNDLHKDVAFEVAEGGRDLIISGSLMEALRTLDREVFAAAAHASPQAAE